MERSGKAFKVKTLNNVAHVQFDLEGEKINKLFELPLRELEEILDGINADSSIKALLFYSAKKNSFIVGADINVIQTLKDDAECLMASRLGQTIFNKLEDLKIPTIAAVDGACMGGGTELILSCRYRVCSDSDKTLIALPEVKLGLLPGWGGCYRLPKKVGLMNAVEMITSGKNVRAKKAVKIGLVDAMLPQELLIKKATQFAEELAGGGKARFKKPVKRPLAESLLTNNLLGKKVFFGKAKEAILKASRGHYPAPLKALELIRSKSSLSREKFLAEEARRFVELWKTEESKNLVRLFLMMDANKKENPTSLSPEELKALPQVSSIAILGAGVMGGGIAYQSAKNGIFVSLKDLNREALANALRHARALLNKKLKRRHISVNELDQTMARIRGQLDHEGFRGKDLVIEAIVENIDIKKKVFAELEKDISDDCIVASNTSSLRVTEMATAFQKPERFVGLHFFNPVDKMPLIEVIQHERTDPRVVAKAFQYSRNIGKTPVLVNDGPGFLVNRLLMPWLNEAGYCLDEGYRIESTDKILKNFGMPMGPFELLDEVGLDVASKVGKILYADFGERSKPSRVLEVILGASSDNKRLGRKTGLGFYQWSAPGGKRVQAEQSWVDSTLFSSSTPQTPEHNPEGLVWRMLFPMINEAAMALEEKIVERPDQVDLAMIFGTGFPPFRGGLCRWADSVGLKRIVGELERMSSEIGPRFSPSEALKRFAKEKGKFYP